MHGITGRNDLAIVAWIGADARGLPHRGIHIIIYYIFDFDNSALNAGWALTKRPGRERSASKC